MNISAQIIEACKIVGDQKTLATMLSVTPSNVNQWISGVRPVPAVKCVEIEKLTRGVIARQTLHKDWAAHWPELARRNRKAKNTPAEQSALSAE